MLDQSRWNGTHGGHCPTENAYIFPHPRISRGFLALQRIHSINYIMFNILVEKPESRAKIYSIWLTTRSAHCQIAAINYLK